MSEARKNFIRCGGTYGVLISDFVAPDASVKAQWQDPRCQPRGVIFEDGTLGFIGPTEGTVPEPGEISPALALKLRALYELSFLIDRICNDKDEVVTLALSKPAPLSGGRRGFSYDVALRMVTNSKPAGG